MKRNVFTRLLALLIVLSIAVSGLIACDKNNEQDDTPAYAGVFTAQDGNFFIGEGEVIKSKNKKLAFKLSAVITENYYNQLKADYGTNFSISFFALAGKIESGNRVELAKSAIPAFPLEFVVENNVSLLNISGTVEIDGYNFTEEEFDSFFTQGYFGEIYAEVAYIGDEGDSALDKITAYGKDNFSAYSPDNENIKIAQFNFFILKTVETANLFLMEDVDLEGIIWTPSSRFKGVFDGQEHVIKNLSPVRTGTDSHKDLGTGMFFSVARGTVIKNVGFVNAKHDDERVGIICGEVRGNITIENVFVHVVGDVSSFNGMIYYSVNPINFNNVFIYGDVGGSTDKAGLFVGRAGNNVFTFEDCIGVCPKNTYNGIFGSNKPMDKSLPYEDRVINGKENKDYSVFESVEQAIQSPNFSNLSVFIQTCISEYVS